MTDKQLAEIICRALLAIVVALYIIQVYRMAIWHSYCIGSIVALFVCGLAGYYFSRLDSINDR